MKINFLFIVGWSKKSALQTLGLLVVPSCWVEKLSPPFTWMGGTYVRKLHVCQDHLLSASSWFQPPHAWLPVYYEPWDFHHYYPSPPSVVVVHRVIMRFHKLLICLNQFLISWWSKNLFYIQPKFNWGNF